LRPLFHLKNQITSAYICFKMSVCIRVLIFRKDLCRLWLDTGRGQMRLNGQIGQGWTDNGKTEGDRGEGGGAEVGRTILEETTKRACLCSVFCLYYKNDSLIKQIK
jgi:hypothetical protein